LIFCKVYLEWTQKIILSDDEQVDRAANKQLSIIGRYKSKEYRKTQTITNTYKCEYPTCLICMAINIKKSKPKRMKKLHRIMCNEKTNSIIKKDL